MKRAIDTDNLRLLASQAANKPVRTLEFIREGTNSVFKSEDANIIIRVQHIDHLQEFEDNLRTVRQLISDGAPFLRPLSPGIAWDEETVVTAWTQGIPTPHNIENLALCLQSLHAIDSDIQLPQINISQRFEKRLRNVESELGEDIASILWNKVSIAQEVFDRACSQGTQILHADAHGGNVVTLNGQPLLIDLDGISRGPREFDMLPSYTRYVRFHRDHEIWQNFQAAYGVDNADWNLLDEMRVIRETTMNTWLSTVARTNSLARAELEHRLATWDAEPFSHEPWKAV